VLYVEPLYLAADTPSALPQIQRVLVAYSDHVIMEPTLDAALSSIFAGNVIIAGTGAAATSPQPASTSPAAAKPATAAPDVQALIREANQHYERALQLQRQGDWAGYGEEVKKLGEALRKLGAQQK